MQYVIFVKSEEGDWVSTYVGGRLIDSGHSVRLDLLFKALEIEMFSVRRNEDYNFEARIIQPDVLQEIDKSKAP